jgi:hypothetical protein
LTICCADFDKLRNRVHAEKGDFRIEKVMAVGAVEVLFIAKPGQAANFDGSILVSFSVAQGTLWQFGTAWIERDAVLRTKA